MNQPYDANKLQKYQALEGKLLKSLIEGEKKRGRINDMQVTQCRTCGKILIGGETKCPECGKPILLEGRGR
jgi:rubrerythrin